jgi:hypothetical protein
MVRRYGLRDDQWKKRQDGLPGRPDTVGVTANDPRLFVAAGLYREGCSNIWLETPTMPTP